MTEDFVHKAVDHIRSEDELRLFFDRLINDDRYQRMFFGHPNLLFPELMEETSPVSLPFLFWNNLNQIYGTQNIDELDEAIEDSEYNVLATETELQEKRLETSQEWLQNTVTDEIPGFSGLLKDLVAFYAIQIFRKNDELAYLVDRDEFSYPSMKEELKDYSDIDLDVFHEGKSVLGMETDEDLIDEDVRNKIANALNIENDGESPIPTNLLDMGFDNFANITDMMNMDHGLIGLHQSSLDMMMSICEVQNLTVTEYRNVLEDLHRLDLIETKHTVIHCEHCRDNPPMFTSQSDLNVSNLEMDCMQCGEPLRIHVLFTVDDFIKECVDSKDGILSTALGWKLHKENTTFRHGVSVADFECDFIVEGDESKTLIEVKMHDTSKDADSVRGGLEKNLSQLFDHAAEFDDLDQAYVLCNYDLEQFADQVELAKSSFSEEVADYNTEILSYSHLPQISS